MSTLYFAYGSNMDPRQMEYRCPGAKIAGVAILEQWRFLINQRGYATVIRAETSVVHGILWHLTPANERALDVYEAVPEGMYVREFMQVKHVDGSPMDALVYVANHFDPGPPRKGYLEKIIHGAREIGLPPAYVEELSSWQREH